MRGSEVCWGRGDVMRGGESIVGCGETQFSYCITFFFFFYNCLFSNYTPPLLPPLSAPSPFNFHCIYRYIIYFITF